MSQLEDSIRRARRISTSIIAITSADQEATIQQLLDPLKDDTPVLRYDVARGVVAMNDAGLPALQRMVNGDMEMAAVLGDDPATALIQALALPPHTVLFFLNAQRQIGDARVAQAIANMRDPYRADQRTIVLLAPQITLPEQLAGDVMTLDDPLPSPEEISSLLDQSYGYVGSEVPPPSPETRRRAVEAVRGLHAAAIDQAFAYAMEPTGIDVAACWHQKRTRVEQTRGLTFYNGGETYRDVGGLVAFKTFMEELYQGPEPFKLIVWLDEIEKTMTGSTGYHGDGGVSADQLGCTLTSMEDNGWAGAIAVGPPGAGKSFIAKASGNTFGVPCVRMDLGAMKGGIVGESEQHIRQAMKVILGIAGGGCFFIATCNNMTSLPPELVRRFSLGGTWFFDLPDEDEKQSIWKLNMQRFGIEEQPRPDDTDWTGSDIRNCCQSAYRRRRDLSQTATQVIPFAQREPAQLVHLRHAADGSYLSASYEGAYRYKGVDPAAPKITVPVQPMDSKVSFN